MYGVAIVSLHVRVHDRHHLPPKAPQIILHLFRVREQSFVPSEITLAICECIFFIRIISL